MLAGQTSGFKSQNSELPYSGNHGYNS